MKKKKKEPVKRLYPDWEDPKYGERFFVLGLQLEDIDGRITELLEFNLGEIARDPYTGEDTFIPKLYSVGKTFGEWRRNKEKLSDEIVTGLNKNMNQSYQNQLKTTPFPSLVEKPVNFKQVTVFQIKYFGEKKSRLL